ncbi:mRNA cleavage and polyadenylation factor subunit [Coemansia sp. RSA 552]|nr:mRNA cleavage and polyadenylation factor subunit [Coemansia sp. RSA 552]
MRDPVYTYCREVLPPSVVEQAVGLSFTRPGASNLALARGNTLEVYEVGLVLKKEGGGDDGEVPGDEYMYRPGNAEEFDLPMLRDDSPKRGRGGAFASTKQPQLHLVGRWSLHGRIMDLQPVRCSKGHAGGERLLLSFAEAKMSLVSFDPSTQSIVTESIHYYEHDALKQHTFNDSQTCDLRADPESRCAALRLYGDQLAILPFAVAGEKSAAPSAKPYADSFVVDLRTTDVDVRNIRDFVFLAGYLEPTLALLHEQTPTWAGRVEHACDTCATTVVSLDLTRRAVSVISTTARLPYDCQRLLAVPDPIGGVLVLAASSVTHVANGAVSCISILNKAATHGIGAAMQNHLDRTNVDLELVLNPHACAYAQIGPATVALWTQQGCVFLLRLSGNGRLVKRIVAKQIAGPAIQDDDQPPVPHSWDDISLLPACATRLQISRDEEGRDASDELLFFVGGRSGRSLLLGIRNTTSSPAAVGPGAQNTPADTKDLDIDADIYGDPAPMSATTPNGASGKGPEPVGGERSDQWADRYSTTVYDEILGTGAVVDMDVGVSASSTGAGSNGEGLELVTCMGDEWRGSLCIQQRHVQPEVAASFDLPGAPVRGVWTVRCLKEYNIGGVMQAADNINLADLNDTFMVLTRDTTSTVFAAGDELQELSRTGFFTTGPTVEVGEVLGHTRIVQVHTQGIRIVNAAGRETQSIDFEPGQTAVSAEVADPYVLVHMRGGEIAMFEASASTGKLRDVAVPGLLKDGNIVAASFFEDVHHVLSSNKEWAGRNKEALGDQVQAEASSAMLVDDFDDLYADTQAQRKRKRAHKQTTDGDIDDLYDEAGESDGHPADEDAEKGGGMGSRQAPNGEGTRLEEGARAKEASGENPMYLVVVLDLGELKIIRLPQFECVWTTLRIDSLMDTLAAAAAASGGGDSGPGARDSDEGAPDGGNRPGTPQGAADMDRLAHGRRVDQLRLAQLGGDNISSACLVILMMTGEIAVYRAFEHCAQEYVARRAAAGEEELADDDGLALRFARQQHDVFAYDSDYQAKVRRASARQARAFAAWEARSKERQAEQEQAEQEARQRAKAKRQREDAMAVADWSDDMAGESADEAPAGKGPSEEGPVETKDPAEPVTSAAADPTGAVDDLYGDDGGRPSVFSSTVDAEQDDDAEGESAYGAGMYPLESARKIVALDNLGGYPAVFVSGLRPVLVMGGPKRYARVHPIRLSVRLPAPLQSAEGEGHDLLAAARPVLGLARFHSTACAHGLVSVTQAGTVVVGGLAAAAGREVRGGVEYDAPWPVRAIPVGTAHSGIGTQGGVAFHGASGSYAVAATTAARFFTKEPNPDIADRQARDAAAAKGERAPPQGMVIPEHARRDLRTTSVAPRVGRFHIDLLSPVTWETVDSHVLAPNEHVAALRTLELESTQHGGRRTLLCVGTGFVLGEDVMSRGNVYIFDVVDVVPLPGRPQTCRRLKLLCREEFHGAVSALGELRGNLVMSVGSKIYVRSFANGESLVSFAFLDCQAWVRSLAGLRSFLVVGDLTNGLWFAGFQEEGPARLHVLGRDAHGHLPVEATDFLVMGTQMQLLAADAYGNLHFFVYAPRDVHSFGGQRLLRRGEYSLRSRAVTIRRLTAPGPALRHVCLVATASGAVHVATMLPEKTFKRLHRINTQMIHGVPPLAGLNPREFRAVPLHQRQHHAPRRTVLDADLLSALYVQGPVSRQRDAAERVGTNRDRVMQDIAEIEIALT